MDTKKLRQKILDLAIHGKLVPQDPNDEPASVLLERIKAEKERLIKEGKIKRSKKSAKTSDTPHYQQDVPFDIPNNWVWCKLKDCCHIVGRIGFRGYTKDDLVPEKQGAITLSPSNIVEDIMNYDKCTYISWAKYEESPEIKVIDGDILLVKTGSSFGKCALVSNLPQKATINPQFVVLKYIQIEKQYLTWVLQSGYARICYENFVLGTAIPTFTQAVLGDMLIPLPSITEQHRIVAEIERWFSLINIIENNKEDLQTTIKQIKNKILDLAIQGKLVPQDPNDEPAAELLKRINPKAEIPCDNGHYQNVPDSWCITDIKSSFTINPKNKVADDVIAGFVPMTNILDGYSNEFRFESRLWGDIKKGFTHFADGDIVVAKISPCLENRKSVIVTSLPNGIGAGTTELFVFRSQCVLPEYGLYFFKSDFFINHCVGTFNGVVGQQRVSKSIIENIKFLLPPISEQRRIVDAVHKVFAKLDAIMENL